MARHVPFPFAACLLLFAFTACGGDRSADKAKPQANGSAPPAAAAGVTDSGILNCAAPAASTDAAPDGDTLEADTPGSDGTRLFPAGSTFQLSVTTRSAAADVVNWTIADTWGRSRASGQFPVIAGPRVSTLDCKSTIAGYFAVSVSLASAGGGVRSRGTRPNGIATFGVLPDISAVLPAASYARQDLHRFGGQGTSYLAPGQTCCDGDGYRPLYPALGLSWANDNRNWYKMEPNGPNTFNPATDQLASYFKPGDLMRLIQLDGIPDWASPVADTTHHAYAPKSLPAYQDYMTRVGQESNTVRTRYFPAQSANYYQVTWEPDYDGGLPWKDTDANFVAMYRATWQGIHAGDPSAVVMGTTNAFLRQNSVWIERLVPLGIAQYLDGVTAHGYYDAGTSPSHPPERLVGAASADDAANALPASMRELRHVMATRLKRGAKLFVTETGISYDIGSTYGPDYPTQNILFAHGAVTARTHLIMLGEGADVSFVFYAADAPIEPGYGIFFDLASASGSFGTSSISPKPAALAVAVMTRLIDGTNTLGPLKALPAGVYGYAFQRLGSNSVVTALWTHNNANWSASTGFSATYSVPYTLQVDAPGTSGSVAVLDMMGNVSTVPYANGVLTLTLTEAPIYVISANATVAQAGVTTPEGYIAQ
ncbi:hypothetical protein AB4Z48_13380 [Cupriavidus sp. 2TAF22]|uniref:hypothetical protein n=1 Tax=unclassified Cupriavidus TaxID=2640874 RepID=UPI003F8E642A